MISALWGLWILWALAECRTYHKERKRRGQ